MEVALGMYILLADHVSRMQFSYKNLIFSHVVDIGGHILLVLQ